MAAHLRTALVTEALEMAVKQRRPAAVIHHSDQGCQYTSLAFGARCQEWGVTPSMGSVGDCFDNAMAESFFATLECELLDRTRWATHAEARSAVFAFIEGWYNTRRRHSALGYLSPLDFERLRETAPADGGPARRGARTRGPGCVRRAGAGRRRHRHGLGRRLELPCQSLRRAPRPDQLDHLPAELRRIRRSRFRHRGYLLLPTG